CSSDLRTSPPATISNEKVIRILDYESSIDKNLVTGQVKKMDLPKSNVLQFYTEKGTKVSVRPSGTEPKIKFYISVNSKLSNKADFEKVNLELENKIGSIKKELNP
ncbi:MAG: phospho-sugar mutase, partial [Cyclobacteriaceae bacterium]